MSSSTLTQMVPVRPSLQSRDSKGSGTNLRKSIEGKPHLPQFLRPASANSMQSDVSQLNQPFSKRPVMRTMDMKTNIWNEFVQNDKLEAEFRLYNWEQGRAMAYKVCDDDDDN